MGAMLEQKQIPPPYRPRLENERDLANFPPEFTDEPVQLTPDDASIIGKIDQSEFEGFEYVNPLLMSAEDVVWEGAGWGCPCWLYCTK